MEPDFSTVSQVGGDVRFGAKIEVFLLLNAPKSSTSSV